MILKTSKLNRLRRFKLIRHDLNDSIKRFFKILNRKKSIKANHLKRNFIYLHFHAMLY